MSKEYHERYGNDPNYQWVNCCEMYVKKSQMILIDGVLVCPYHQRVMQGEDGPYLLYEEFNQDGE